MPLSLNRGLIDGRIYADLPYLHPSQPEQLNYPERIIQFGSGAFLRGFLDFFIDQANRQKVFRGRAVIVNNTHSGRSDAFNQQDGLFTLCVEGYSGGDTRKDYYINSAVSRALPAADRWPEVLACAANPNITIITSNTTEVGITLQENDDLSAHPPQSFPGKLTAYLYERFRRLGGSADTGMTILPTELLIDNGSKLRDIVLRLAELNGLDSAFVTWLKEHNQFCNTLVDRIVPGEPNVDKRQTIEEALGYQDRLLTVSEVYRFFAIEGEVESLHKRVSFLKADPNIVIASDIAPFRERKLRILNGGHTISVAAGFLSGLETVYDCMQDETLSGFIKQTIRKEIVPSLDLDQDEANRFASDVLDRFRNPFLNHQLISISLQYTSKMNMRNGLTFERYYKKFGRVPERMCAGFAAYLLFTRPVREEDGVFYGKLQDDAYPIQDEQADYFYRQWQSVDLSDQAAVIGLVKAVLTKTSLWSQDLLRLGDFQKRIVYYLQQFEQQGVHKTLEEL